MGLLQRVNYQLRNQQYYRARQPWEHNRHRRRRGDHLRGSRLRRVASSGGRSIGSDALRTALRAVGEDPADDRRWWRSDGVEARARSRGRPRRDPKPDRFRLIEPSGRFKPTSLESITGPWFGT